MADLDIHWPDQYHPDNCAVHVVNQLGLDVSAEAAWNCLIRATEWPNWYPNSVNVRLLGPEKTTLDKGVRFRWKTFGMTITCLVEEFEPYERLAWSSESMGMRVYQAWFSLYLTAEHWPNSDTNLATQWRVSNSSRRPQLTHLTRVD